MLADPRARAAVRHVHRDGAGEQLVRQLQRRRGPSGSIAKWRWQAGPATGFGNPSAVKPRSSPPPGWPCSPGLTGGDTADLSFYKRRDRTPIRKLRSKPFAAYSLLSVSDMVLCSFLRRCSSNKDNLQWCRRSLRYIQADSDPSLQHKRRETDNDTNTDFG